jgi:uncharacterized protein (DUF305 family)
MTFRRNRFQATSWTLALVATLVFAAFAASAQAPLTPTHHEGTTPPPQWDPQNMTADEMMQMCMMPMGAGGMPAGMMNASQDAMVQMCMMPMPGPMMNASSDVIERMYLMRMYLHHRGAVAMAELVPGRATHADLVDLARNITTSQAAEMEVIAGMLTARHNMTPQMIASMNASRMGHMMSIEAARLANLTGAQFETAFMDRMIMHHQMAIDMSQAVVGRGMHGDAEALAQGIVASQGPEIDRMKAWRTAWAAEPSAPAESASPTPTPTGEQEAPALSTLSVFALLAALAMLARSRRRTR